MDDDRVNVVLFFSIEDSESDRRNVLCQGRFSFSVKVASQRQRQGLLLIAVRARNRRRVLCDLVDRFECHGDYSTRRMGRIDYPVRASGHVHEVIVAIVRDDPIALRNAYRSQDQATSMIGPT